MFFVEYIGPLLLWPVFNRTLSLTSIMWYFHYVKREFETFFVHVFSNETMPIKNLVRNSAYYWSFAALNAFMARDVYVGDLNVFLTLSLIGFFFCELMNGYCHVVLRNLRPKGSTEYVNPTNPLFVLVACPNYSFELLSWLCFGLFVRNAAAFAFLAAGFYQINQWAREKQQRLAKTFGKAGERKYRLFVGIL